MLSKLYILFKTCIESVKTRLNCEIKCFFNKYEIYHNNSKKIKKNEMVITNY